MNQLAVSVSWLSNDQAAEYLGVKPQTLRQWRAAGYCGRMRGGELRKPPKSYQVGGKISYRPADLEAWLEKHAR